MWTISSAVRLHHHRFSICERHVLATAGDRGDSIELAKDCFARLVRACFGISAISNHKLEHGRQLVILGIQIELDGSGATFWPSPDKVEKWSDTICKALMEDVIRLSFSCTLRSATIFSCIDKALCSGEASKLSGKLQWGSQAAFGGFGRAMLRPILDQQKARSSRLTRELRLALDWWSEFLQLEQR